MKRVLYLKADDWEALYVDGNVVSQGHQIQPMELLELAEKHHFTHLDVANHWATSEDEERCNEDGEFPAKQSDLKGTYA